MFCRALLPVVLIFTTCAASAQDVAPDACLMTDGQDNCVRVLACIGDQGRWFKGRSFGRGSGELSGEISDGVQCKGTWTNSNALGLGQADVACDDGMRVTVMYYHQDAYTGTALGRGVSSTGDAVRSWSGLHVLDYLREQDPSGVPNLPCTLAGILMS